MGRSYQKTSFGIHAAQRKENHAAMLSSNFAVKSNLLISTSKVSTQEAELAKEKMHGRLACGRPLVVRLASEKQLEDISHDHSKRSLPEANRPRFVNGSSSGQMSRDEKVAAIKNKLKALEEDEKRDPKKQKR
ncbi:predicted protein [Arabidopsis lyrata subsp. lyrata]|uniref:Predicted protein n=1 Tax=Arabidopsis lyrata subsp. lyrata TaxID=81972 RepID=D7MS61_ARALL|nr:predicted protein [Arabidopsis lyrata subsp. lyrata]